MDMDLKRLRGADAIFYSTGYGTVEHLWCEPWVARMRKEAIQVAAMAMRFVLDVCDGERGQK